MTEPAPSTFKLVLVPAIITLAVTLLRLEGELKGWSPQLFSREPGGAGALVGIVWLVFVFGIYFAYKLARAGEGPTSAGRAVGFAVLSLLAIPVAIVVSRVLKLGVPAQIGIFGVASLVSAYVAYLGWPALGRVLFVYGLLARIPVAVVMLLAIQGNWGTHYDAPPPNFPAMTPFLKWVVIGLVPQLTLWIGFTLAVGVFVGGITAAIMGSGRRAAVPSAA